MKARFLLALSLAFGSVFFAIPAKADVITAWENDTLGIYLPEGVTFLEVHGWYGSPDDAACGVDVSDVLTALAVGQNHFDIDANNSVFGDPCGGVYKVLRITDITADWSQQVVPVLQPTLEPTPLPTVEPSPEVVVPVQSVDSVDVVEPVVPVVEPVVTPPVIVPQPQPEPIPFPVEPKPAPAPIPEPAPTAEPAPVPVPTVEPAPPTPEPIAPSPVAAPAPAPAPVVVVTPAPLPEPVKALVEADPATLDPKVLTDIEVAQLTEAAVSTLAIEPQGSPAYNQALEQLMVVAQADDPEIPTELAAIPLLGDAAVAVLDAFNQLGNFGSDISPKVRKQAKKEAIATIAVGTATTASTVAAAGSVGYRRKETP